MLRAREFCLVVVVLAGCTSFGAASAPDAPGGGDAGVDATDATRADPTAPPCIDAGTCRPEKLVQLVTNPTYLAIDHDYLYFASSSKTVNRMRLAGGDSQQLGTEPTTCGLGPIAVDEGFVYWVNGCARPAGAVRKVPVSGGAAIDVATNESFPSSIAVDSFNIYWTTHELARALVVVGKQGSSNTGVLGTTTDFLGGAVATDASGVFWSEGDSTGSGKLHQTSAAGGDTVLTTSVSASLEKLALTHEAVFGVANGVLWRAPKTARAAAGSPMAPAVSVPHNGFATDGETVYYLARDGDVTRLVVRSPEGKATNLAVVAKDAHSLVLGPHAVYWSNPTDGTIEQLAR
jgi:hypothetical protein